MPTINPANVSSSGYDLYCSDTRIVRLDEATGKLYAYGVGTATVTVQSKGTDEWGIPVTATCEVKVEEAFMLSGAPYVTVGNTTQIFLTYPTDAVIETKVWKTSDESKLTVNEKGEVTGVAHTYNTVTKQYGEVTVSCTINGVTTVSWKMQVAAVQPQSIYTPTLPNGETEISLYVDETFSVASTIMPEDIPAGAYRIVYQVDGLPKEQFQNAVINPYSNQGITMSPTVFYVDMSVENEYGEYYMVRDPLKKRLTVRVLPYLVKSITLEDLKLEINQSAPLTAKLTSAVAGKNPSITTLTWQSGNESIATVDQNGKVTAVSPGETTITATAQDGSNVSASCKVTITEPWKEFNVGDYVVRTSNGDIDFSADLSTAKSKGTIVGIVITKTNPRATDTELPESCTHGIAIALGEGSEGKWWSDSFNNTWSILVSSWANSNGRTFIEGDNKYSGYSNTLTLKAFIAATNGVLTSTMLNVFDTFRSSAPTIPNKTSGYYIPSALAMKDVGNISNQSWAFADKILGAGGVRFTNNNYWTVSEAQRSNAWSVNPVTGAASSSGKTSENKTRYVFAF